MNAFYTILPAWTREWSLWGNVIEDYIVAAIAFIVILFVCRMFHYAALWRLEKLSEMTKNDLDGLLIDVLQSVRWWFYIYLSFWIALLFLDIGSVVQNIFDAVLIILIVYQVVRGAGYVVEYLVGKQFKQAPKGQENSIASLLSKLVRGILWVLGFLFVLQNLGIDVTSLIAGLGIGGIAIALALQNILSDLFSSLSIYFDKPFQVGDFIAVGELMGTVEHIGIKTTRLRSLQGEEIIMANRDLTDARIQNYRGMAEWRGAFSVGVTYDTAPDSLDEIKQMIEDVVAEQEGARFERANATRFAESAINFDVVFYSQTNDYNKHLEVQHAIHTELKRRFNDRRIDIAFPTRTIYLNNS